MNDNMIFHLIETIEEAPHETIDTIVEYAINGDYDLLIDECLEHNIMSETTAEILLDALVYTSNEHILIKLLEQLEIYENFLDYYVINILN